ncbi:hypothetical protein P9112_009371 [Eukaryota sp. TZLM1-RC]
MGNTPSRSVFDYQHLDVIFSCHCQVKESDPLSVSNLLSQFNKPDITYETSRPEIALYYHEIILPFLSHPQSFPLLPFFLFCRLPSFLLKEDTDLSPCTNHSERTLFEKHCLHSFISDCYQLKKVAVCRAQVRKRSKKRNEEFQEQIERSQAPSFAKKLVNSWRSIRMYNYYLFIGMFCKVVVDLVFPDEGFLLRQFQEHCLVRFPKLRTVISSCDRQLFTRQVNQCVLDFFDRDSISMTEKEPIFLENCTFFVLLSSLSEFYTTNTKYMEKSFYSSFLFAGSRYNFHSSKSMCHYCLCFPIPVVHIHPRIRQTLDSRSICLACCKFLSMYGAFECKAEISFNDVLLSTDFSTNSDQLEFCVNDVPSYLMFFRRFCSPKFFDFTQQFAAKYSQLRPKVLSRFRNSVDFDTCPPFKLSDLAPTRPERAAAKDFAEGLNAMIGILNSHKALSLEDSRSFSVFYKRLKRSFDLEPHFRTVDSCTFSLTSVRLQNLLLHLFDEICVFDGPLSFQKSVFPTIFDLLSPTTPQLVIDSDAVPLLSCCLYVGIVRFYFKKVSLTPEDLDFLLCFFRQLKECLKKWTFNAQSCSERFSGPDCYDDSLSPNYDIEQLQQRFGLSQVVCDCLEKIISAHMLFFKFNPVHLFFNIIKIGEIPEEFFSESLIGSIEIISLADFKADYYISSLEKFFFVTEPKILLRLLPPDWLHPSPTIFHQTPHSSDIRVTASSVKAADHAISSTELFPTVLVFDEVSNAEATHFLLTEDCGEKRNLKLVRVHILSNSR